VLACTQLPAVFEMDWTPFLIRKRDRVSRKPAVDNPKRRASVMSSPNLAREKSKIR